MMNTSATGGYLTPSGWEDYLKDETVTTFPRFMHSVLVGVTGLPREMVRPAFQRTPYKMPDYSTDWMAYNLTNFTGEKGSGYSNGSCLSKHETFECVCYFYGDKATEYASTARDGFELSQNRSSLLINGMGYNGASSIVRVPQLVNDQYYEQVNMTFYFSREIKREYHVLNFSSVAGSIHANSGDTVFVDELLVKESGV